MIALAPATVFITIIEDRHADTDAYVFSTAEAAIDFARETAQDFARYEDDYQESDVKGFLFHATYSPENDGVWVVERELDSTE